MPTYMLGILVPARLAGYAKFAAGAVDDALLNLYVNQPNIAESSHNVFSGIGRKITVAAKQATAAAAIGASLLPK